MDIHKVSRYQILLLLVILLLAACQSAVSTPEAVQTVTPTAQPSLRGQGGTLRMLYWEAPTILNPHLTVNVKDWEAARITYEPLASFDAEDNLVPFLAADIPTLDNGGVAADGRSVTWQLRRDARWCDGEPFTAADVAFTFEYVTNEAVASSSSSVYDAVADVVVLDDHTIQIVFKEATPAWALPFVGIQGVILPEHVFAPYNGANAREAPANNQPVGTGPYCVVEPGIKPQEVLLLGTELVETNKIVYEANSYFRDPDKPYFSKIILRGGGTVDEAARRVFQTGDADYAYYLTQIPAENLEAMEELGEGEMLVKFGSNVEFLFLNFTDPRTPDAGGERSSLDVLHPFFSDARVRQAVAYAIDRQALVDLYGDVGQLTYNNLVLPQTYRSDSVFYPHDPQRARELLEEAGWQRPAPDEPRVNEEGEELQVVWQALIAPQGTALEQMQRIVRQNLQDVGIDVQLKIQDASVMFDDPNVNPDSVDRFNADLVSFGMSSDSPDPRPYMQFWTCDQIPQQENNWMAGYNTMRWCNQEYDALYQEAVLELDPERRRELFLQMNDLVIEEVAMIPLVLRGDVSGVSTDLTGIEVTPWDANTWKIMDWRRGDE